VNATELIELTQRALADQQVLQVAFKQSFQYDCAIGEQFSGNYNMLPGALYPYPEQYADAVCVVKMQVERDGREKTYAFMFFFSADGLSLKLSHPGDSHANPQLFHDMYPAALAAASARMEPASTSDIYLKDTQVTREPTPDGWQENWHWIDQDGTQASTLITLRTAGGDGVHYVIESAPE
jgi:hypothetical protein